MKRICIIGLALILLFSGCMRQAEHSPSTSDPNNAIMQENKALHFNSLENYQKYGPRGPRNNPFDYVTYPRNFVFYENIRDLGSFVFFHSYTYLGGNPVYIYRLNDGNNIGFDFVFNHDGFDSSPVNLVELPSSAKNMAQIEVSSETDTKFYIESNGFLYCYDSSGILNGISGEVNEIGFYIHPIVKDLNEYNFLDYPLDGERTLLSLLLSTSSRDHQAAMRMMRRCLPKTWVQYTIYCAVPVVILAGLAVWAVLIYKKKHKALASPSTAPAAQDPPTPDTPQ